MPKRLWWLTLIACECTGADPAVVASVMRFESDFRTGIIGHGLYVAPMGIQRDFAGKYPIHDVFGNILTGARRLAQFKSKPLLAALRGYNKDRSKEFAGYCRDVRAGKEEVGDYVRPVNDWSWRAAVDLGKWRLFALEIQAQEYAYRCH